MPKRFLFALGVLVVLAFAGLSWIAGGPQNVYGLVRYALPQMRRGELRVGDPAPNVELTALDGHSSFSVRERIGHRPLVLIFGSYT